MEDCGREGLACLQKQTDGVPSISSFKRRCFGEDSSECAKFDGYPLENLKQWQEENAASIGFEFRIQEQNEELQNSDVLKRTTSRAKRSKCVYLLGSSHNSTDSARDPKCLENQPITSTVDRSSLKAAKATCSKSSESGSSSSSPHLDDLDSNGVYKPSEVSKQCLIQDLKNQNRDETVKKPGEFMAFDVEEIPQSAFFDNADWEAGNRAAMGMILVDVHLTVEASNRAENIPFVCLTSQLTGQAILGYPLEVAELSKNFETMLPRKENVPSRFQRLVWRTSRRTPVCYVTNSLSSISKSLQGSKASETVQDSIPSAKEDHSLINKETVTKYRKSSWEGAHQGQGAASSACVPVELVFSKVLAAVNHVNS